MNRRITIFVTTLILIGVISFCRTGFVFSQSEDQCRIEDSYRDKMEEDYQKQVQELLESKHLYRSGITLTKIIYPNGYMSYQMTIHNKVIDNMPYYEKSQLMKELKNVDFPDQESTITHQFLET